MVCDLVFNLHSNSHTFVHAAFSVLGFTKKRTSADLKSKNKNVTFVMYYNLCIGKQIKPHVKIEMFKMYNLPVLVCTQNCL